MAGIASEESAVGRSFEGISSGQRCQSGEALVEWRSSEQLENGTPSTSPPYWDTDDDEYGGPKPSELYGKYTWKIDKFSQINKRELRSNAFEVGGYKWYILIYPQGCDVCNHLSLFLCVANHDKLLPGWSHFAQFTIAVVNKDPKKSKYSDTLHRFWKKEHDWGWKKFMELSKVLDGFIDADTLIIKAQVQVIRERADRPFRCLDCQYRRELVRVYLTNVEQICRRFVEERRTKLGKFIEDKARWSSFCTFWLEIDQNSRGLMSREKTEAILRVVVKHFFIEKEVTSTLVMDSLYSGLKALEGQTKNKMGRGQLLDVEELPVPIVCIDKDMFVLVDDVLLLLERAAIEPLPPKDDKGPQNRTKDGNSGEDFNKDTIERDEIRLTELGRRTIEIFVLAHIFSKIEVAYQEAVALKRQEELIREEAAWLAESEQKGRRGVAEKEKKSKKKQGKQKRNNRKGKDKGRDDKSSGSAQNKLQQESTADERKDFTTVEAEPVLEKPDVLGDVSDLSDSNPEILQPESEDRDASPANWDTDTSEVHPPTEASSSGVTGISSVQNGVRERNSPSTVDDSSSTCSTDSVPSAVTSGPYKGNSSPNKKSQMSPSRGRNQRGRASSDESSWASEALNLQSEATKDATQEYNTFLNCKAKSESEVVVLSLQDTVKGLEHHVVKEDAAVSLQRELNVTDQADAESPSREKVTEVPSSPSSCSKNLPSAGQENLESKTAGARDPVLVRKLSDGLEQAERRDMLVSAVDITVTSKSDAHKAAAPKPIEKLSVQQVAAVSRSLSAPIGPGPRPTAPIVSKVQTAPLLAHSVSAAGRLSADPSPATHSYVPQSYLNAMMATVTSPGFSQPPPSPSSVVNPLQSFAQPSNLMPAPLFLPKSSERMEPNSVKPSISFGMVNHDVLQNGRQWMECPQRDSKKSVHYDPGSLHDDIRNIDIFKPVHGRSQDHLAIKIPASTSRRQAHGSLTDEFPHLDIINDLLDDEHAATASTSFQSFSSGPKYLNRQYTFPGDIGMSNDIGPSTSSCRFERTRSYCNDGFQHSCGSLCGHVDLLDDMISQSSPQSYANGQIDGLIPNYWQLAGSDPSFLRMRNPEGDGYPYHIPDYSSLACSVNGYNMFQPSNGH